MTIEQDFETVQEMVMRLHLVAHLDSNDADQERDDALAALSRIRIAMEEADSALRMMMQERDLSAKYAAALHTEVVDVREQRDVEREAYARAARERDDLRAEVERLREALTWIAANEPDPLLAGLRSQTIAIIHHARQALQPIEGGPRYDISANEWAKAAPSDEGETP